MKFCDLDKIIKRVKLSFVTGITMLNKITSIPNSILLFKRLPITPRIDFFSAPTERKPNNLLETSIQGNVIPKIKKLKVKITSKILLIFTCEPFFKCFAIRASDLKSDILRNTLRLRLLSQVK